jgi:hypothetical protein
MAKTSQQSPPRTRRVAELTVAAITPQPPEAPDHEFTDVVQLNAPAEDVHVLLGAFVLGALTCKDRGAFEAHLPWCAPCRSELADLAGVIALSDLLDPAVAKKAG